MRQTRREFAKTIVVGGVTFAIGGWKGCQFGTKSHGHDDPQKYLQLVLGASEAAALVELANAAIPEFKDSAAYFAAFFRDIQTDNQTLFTVRTGQYRDFLKELPRPITPALEQSLGKDTSGFYAKVARLDILAGFFADPIWRGQALHAEYRVWAQMGFNPIFKPAECIPPKLKALAEHLALPPDRLPQGSRSDLLQRAHRFCEMKT